MFIRNRDNHLLLENLKQARQFLSKKDLSEDDEKLFKIIVKLLNRLPNLIYTFTKMAFKDDDAMMNYRELIRLIQWIISNKQITKQLPKNLIQYEDIEELSDDIVQLEYKRKVNAFTKNLYRSMRESINKLTGSVRKTYEESAMLFMELSKEEQSTFTPLKYFEVNHISVKEFVESLERFVNSQDINEEKQRILDYIKDNDEKLKVTYHQNNVIVIQSNNEEVICELGSTSWCIVYSPDAYYSRYLGKEKYNTQYIIYNFNLPNTNANSMFGVTIKPSGDIYSGGTSQNKLNREVSLKTIYETTGIPYGTLVSNHKDKYEEINKEIVEIQKIAEEGNLHNLIRIINKTDPLKLKSHRGDPFKSNGDNIFNIFFEKWNENQKNIVEFLKEIYSFWESDYSKVIVDILTRRTETLSFDKVDISEIKKNINAGFLQNLFNKRNWIKYSVFDSIDDSQFFDLLTWIELKVKDNSNFSWVRNIQYSNKYFSPFFSKYGWDGFIKLLDNNIIIKFLFSNNNITLREEKLTYEEYKSLKKTIFYKKLMNSNDNNTINKTTLRIHIGNELFIQLCIENDKFALDFSSSDTIKTLSNRLLKEKNFDEILEWLSNVDSSNFRILFEQSIIDETIGTKLKEFLSFKTSTYEEVCDNIVKFPKIYGMMSKTFNSDSIYELLKREGLQFRDAFYIEMLIESSSDVTINNSQCVNLGFDSRSVVSLDKDKDDIINELWNQLKDNHHEFSTYKKYVEQYLERRINSFIEYYLTHFVIKREEEESVVEKNNFQTFDEWWKEYLALIPFHNSTKMDGVSKERKEENFYETRYDFFKEIFEKIIDYWGDKSPETWKGKSNSLFDEISLIDVILEIDNNDDMLLENYLDVFDEWSDEIYSLLGEIFAKSDIYKISSSTTMDMCKYYYDDKYKEDFYISMGLEYDEKSNNWYYNTTYDELEGFYEGEFKIQGDNFDDYYGEYYGDIDDLVDNLDLENIKILADYFFKNGFDYLDMGVFDKYDINKHKYKLSMEVSREDKNISNLYDQVTSIITDNIEEEGYEDAFDNVDISEVKNVLEICYVDVETSGIENQWIEDNIDQLNDVLSPCVSGAKNASEALFKNVEYDKNNKVTLKVVPDLNVLLFDIDDIINSIREYSGMDFNIEDLFNTYFEYNNKFTISDSDNYYYFKTNDYEYYNEGVTDRLHWDIITESKSIIKFSDFLVEKTLDEVGNLRQFLGNFYNEEEAKEDLEYYSNQIEELNKNGGELYRLVFLEEVSDLNIDDLGEHWCMEITQLDNFYETLRGEINGLPYLITGHFNPGQVNVDLSFGAYEELPNELEVNLKSEPEKYSLKSYTGTFHAKLMWENNI